MAASSANAQSLTILDAADRHVVQTLALPPLYQLEWYSWAGAGKLVLKMSTKLRSGANPTRASRLMAYDIATRGIANLGPPRLAVFGDKVLYIDPRGDYLLVLSRPRGWDSPEVRRVSLAKSGTASSQVVQSGFKWVSNWGVDANGVVRSGWGSRDGKLTVWHRDKADADLQRLADWPADLFMADPEFRLAVSSNSPDALLTERGSDGKVILTRRPLAGGGPAEVVYAPSGRDVIDFTTDRAGRPVNAVEADDQMYVHWFDPLLQHIQEKLVRALNSARATIVSRADDNSRMVVWAGTARDPGAYWLYDLRTANVSLFSEVSPGLDLNLTSEPRAVAYKTRDGTSIRAYLTLPAGEDARPRALIVMPHDNPFGVRDYLRFDPSVQFLASRGYAVIQPNSRGSSGYGLEFVRLGEGQIGRAMQDDLDDAVEWAVRSGIADPRRVCLVGAGYGGYAALWGVMRNSDRYRCAASLAGVTNLAKILRYDRRSLNVDWYKNWENKVQGDSDVDLDALSPDKQVAQLTRPVLLAHGRNDVNVPFEQYEDMVAAAKRAGKPIETLVLPDEGHSLSKPESRLLWMETLANFLGKHNPAD